MVISAYHDQGLVPFKMLSKGKGVNTTLGLPFVRTSVDHGRHRWQKYRRPRQPWFRSRFCRKMPEVTQRGNRLLLAPAIYDDYMRHVRYQDWADFAIESYQKICGKKPQKILELACGTANISCLLIEKGYRVVGEDISPLQNRRRGIIQKLDNMLQSRGETGFELTLLMFDSLNYLGSKKQVSQLLLAAHSRTASGGVFVFDVSTLKNCQDNFDGLLDYQQNDGQFVMQECFLDGDTRHQNFFAKKLPLRLLRRNSPAKNLLLPNAH